MGEAKFTPGPWAYAAFYSGDNEYAVGVAISDYDQRLSGLITREDFSVAEPVASEVHGEANACLIAAAPDLYEALENIAWATPEKTAFSAEELIEVLRATARAALAKACPTPVVAATDNEGGEQR